MARFSPARLIAILSPGLLVAATGVGAGDLATASLTGSKLGMAVLWVALLGAFLKFVLSEGLTRWQLATGQTVLEGAVARLGRPVIVIFLGYFLIWSYVVGAALASACGVAGHALAPVFADAGHGKIFWGLVQSGVGLFLVWVGGFRLFAEVMKVLVVVMFITVIATAVLLNPDWPAALRGTLLPTLPDLSADTLTWSAALMGGVGGTVTILCYGYWIREAGRYSPADLRMCRVDLFVGYFCTALFGMAMVVIGSTIDLHTSAKGANMLVALAGQLEHAIAGTPGKAARWVFLIGAWAAVFTSLLGVWQAVPYLFADFVQIVRGEKAGSVDRKQPAYRVFLVLIATVPMIGLFGNFTQVQKLYSLIGAYFMPLLALVLLLLTTRAAWIGPKHVSRWPTVVVLLVTLVIFLVMGIAGIGE